MGKRQEAPKGANDFHYENFLRRSRYTTVFLVLVAAFCVITVLNINTGNVDISISKILRIIFLREGEKMEYNIIWKIRLPRILMAAILGGALSLSGFLLQTFFENPIAGPFVLGISSGAKMVVALAMIYFLGKFGGIFVYADHRGIYWCLDRDRIHPSGIAENPPYGNTSGSGYHDRIYLFGSDRLCGNLCGGLGHRQSAWMESGKLFRHELEQCKSGCDRHRNHHSDHVSDVKADRCVSAGRSVCTEYGCEHQIFPDHADSDVECAVRLCDRIRGTDLFRRNRGTVSGKTQSRNFKTTGRDTCHLPRRRCLLYDV